MYVLDTRISLPPYLAMTYTDRPDTGPPLPPFYSSRGPLVHAAAHACAGGVRQPGGQHTRRRFHYSRPHPTQAVSPAGVYMLINVCIENDLTISESPATERPFCVWTEWETSLNMFCVESSVWTDGSRELVCYRCHWTVYHGCLE